MSGLALWDFDGTLALRGGEVGWSRLLVEVLDEHDTGHRLDAEAFRPHLRNGFPWHTPNVPHQHLSSPEQWWGVVQPLLATAYERVGYSAESGRELAAHARRIYVDPSRGWLVFEDVTPVLTQLAERGWRHGIVSNHVPELRSIVVGLGLGDFFEFVHTSAETGYEKPHPEAFAIALRGGGARHAWMIGDNYTADVAGAEAVGLRAVLVRREHPNAERFSADLFGIEHFLEER